ncbi:MAG: BrnT family toxin [Betaproteobacteria bacterium]|nr:BrnT family toxin [Betaproteobacteria bacterium]
MRYEWDTDKAEANLKAHGVSFADAVTVFEDDFALTREDPDAEGEQRFVTLGADATSRLLVVVYTYREPDVTRLISAWKANKTQRTQYESHLG